ncbi:MAG: response regulator [Bdellovibrionales bacterium]
MRNAAKILIVDDDRSSSQMLGEVVKRLGLKAIVVNKPVDAINVVKLQTVNAAIVDILLPKMSGVDLVQEFRKTRFGTNPVVLVSGVFKDKNFASDAIRKTGASAFLFKPFNVEDLTASLQEAFQESLSTEKWTIQTLLSRKLPSPRERAKAIEHLDEILGSDFPYVLCMLMEAQASGHLTLVNQVGEIFGVTLNKGLITELDSSESNSTGVLELIAKGYLSQEDWDEFQKVGHKKFTLEQLIADGLVSPHAVDFARHDQIIFDFKSICGSETIKLNFVPDEGDETLSRHAVKIHEILEVAFESVDEFFPLDYLTAFYKGVLATSVHWSRKPNEIAALWASPLLAGLEDLRAVIDGGNALSGILKSDGADLNRLYRAIHYLVLSRHIIFDDAIRSKDLSAALDRYKKIYEDLVHRSPDKVFEYFGAPPMAPPRTVEALYNQFVKSNGVENLPKDTTPEIREYCVKCNDLVKAAFETMTNEAKRAALMDQMKIEEAERSRKSKELVTQGVDKLRKGQAAQALEMLRQAEDLYPSTLQFLILVWARIKSEVDVTRSYLLETSKKLDSLPSEDRKSAYYYMAMGLVKKQLGDQSAGSYFERAIEADGSFADARRELSNMSPSEGTATKKMDLLTGDITEIVSNLFRKKSG